MVSFLNGFVTDLKWVWGGVSAKTIAADAKAPRGTRGPFLLFFMLFCA